jgi:predicted CoA-binding protein
MRVLLPDGVNVASDPVLEILKKYEKSYARLEDVPDEIEIVNVFRRSEDVPPVVEGAIKIGARVVWMQLGIANAAAAERARAAGLIVVEDACVLMEHRRRAKQLG